MSGESSGGSPGLTSSIVRQRKGHLKVNAVNLPAKKKRAGIDLFTKQERTFAAKPATSRSRLAR